MRTTRALLILAAFACVVAAPARPAFCAEKGGNSSGGGDLLGIGELSPAYETVKTEMRGLGRDWYGKKAWTRIERVLGADITLLKGTPETLAADLARRQREFAARSGDFTQTGSGKSFFTWTSRMASGEMAINELDWTQAIDRAAQYALIHHEICVMAGLEHTGDYRYTAPFQKRLRDRIRRTATYRDVVVRFDLYAADADASGESRLGERRAEAEARARGEGKSPFRTSLDGGRFLIEGCVDSTGYLAFAVSVAGAPGPGDLGPDCRSLAERMNHPGPAVPLRAYFDPTAGTPFEPRLIELPGGAGTLTVHVVRSGLQSF